MRNSGLDFIIPCLSHYSRNTTSTYSDIQPQRLHFVTLSEHCIKTTNRMGSPHSELTPALLIRRKMESEVVWDRNQLKDQSNMVGEL
jgi:hypothetical protein